MKKPDYLDNNKSEISNVCNMVEDHCLQAMKIVHHYANDCFDWLISEQHSVDPWREVISILSGKYKRFTFVHPVGFGLVSYLFLFRPFQAMFTLCRIVKRSLAASGKFVTGDPDH